MGRNPKRKVGARPYANYTNEKLEEALNSIRTGRISQRQAAAQYNIPRRTLNYKLKDLHMKNPGHPEVFSTNEELAFVEHIKAVSEFGFPVDKFDLRCIAKSYLDRQGRKVKEFKNNFPGVDWASAFLRRHADITQRVSSNIKLVRASVSRDVIQPYFNNLEKELEGIPAANIWNYDETCLVDDPGAKKVLTKRGIKYPERLCNSSKANTSIMFCGNASGEMAPPYVNYKAEKMWDLWTIGGPSNARYNRTKSGWFDTESFQDWFETLMLPIMKKQEGRKLLIGDNLSSHLNLRVLQLCRENNISFICLPPNSTHLTQPLDISVFRPMKIAWRHILDNWKKTPSGRRCTTVPKDEFPRLLHKLMDHLAETLPANLKSGFRKAGIFPFGPENVFARIPEAKSYAEVSPNISQCFVDYLEEKRHAATNSRGGENSTDGIARTPRKKKLPVEAGKSVSYEEVQLARQKNSQPTIQQRQKRKKILMEEVVSSADSDSEESCVLLNHENDVCGDSSVGSQHISTSIENMTVGDYVVVSYMNIMYPGVVTRIGTNGAEVSVMCKSKNNWKWPERKDELWYDMDDILEVIRKPKQISARGIFVVPELS